MVMAWLVNKFSIINPVVDYCVHKSSSLDLILRQFNPVLYFLKLFCKISFIVLPSRSHKCSLDLEFCMLMLVFWVIMLCGLVGRYSVSEEYS
jgi:hypothetical protein